MRYLLSVCFAALTLAPLAAQPLPGTKPLKADGDLAAQMVAGIDRYLERATDKSVDGRARFWKPDFRSATAYEKSVAPNRERFRKLIGLADRRVPPRLELVGTLSEPALIAETEAVRIYAVRWAALPGMDGEGLLLKPKGKPLANVVAIPDADQTPEMVAGLANDVETGRGDPFALRLAAAGCQVLVPVLIDRKDTWSGNPAIRMTNQPHREFIYRMAYEMGRHIIGYEVQKVLGAVDWFVESDKGVPVGVVGYGEGGLIALYSGAADTRIAAVGVSGYFGRREELWREPIYRNVWGLLREFGDAEIAGLIAPRALVIEDHAGPLFAGPPKRKDSNQAAPGGTLHFAEQADRGVTEFKRAEALSYLRLPAPAPLRLKWIDARKEGTDCQRWVSVFLATGFQIEQKAAVTDQRPTDLRKNFDPTARLKHQFDQAVAFTQNLLPTAVDRRDAFWSKMDTSSPEKWKESTKPYHDYFHEEIIGKLPAPTVPMNPRTRLIYETPKWKGYEVVLDLYEDVFCYGILLVPNDIKPGERRPVVVCQHGLEGRPTDICNPKERTRFYNSFGAQLADRGYVVFAPQNPYIGQEKFRVLVRKGHPLKLSLYSFIVAQHERIIDWLVTLPFVDARRIAFYGLSYGGKVAMRVAALIERYCAVICSGDFNEWIWKNINLVWRGSYMFTFEYDMYEFDLGNTFNYAEMARLIAPRPFMVERGHDDGVGLDEWVAHEYARVRYLYAKLKIPDRTEIEFFPGGHEIYGRGTFRFLDRHLKDAKD